MGPELLVLGHPAKKPGGLGVYFMFETAMFHHSDRGPAEERLWRAVIARTLEEWVCGPLSHSRKAEKFLFEDDDDFRAVCSSAGMDPDRLRNRLKMIRSRGIQKAASNFLTGKNQKLSMHLPGLIQQKLSEV